jgi:DNA-binding transcriptional MocR family regulator
MSISTLSWARRAGLKGPPQAVLLILASHHNGAGGQCNPSLTTIAREAGVSLSTVKRALDYLSACGLLQVQPRFVNGGRVTSQFRLRIGAKAASGPRQGRAPTQPQVNPPPEPPVGSPPQPTYYAPPQPRVGPPSSGHSEPQKGEGTHRTAELSQEGEIKRRRVTIGRHSHAC